jgi:hypothetical protein
MLAAAPALADIQPPPKGAQFDFACTLKGKPDWTLHWDILKSETNTVVIGERVGTDQYWRELPPYLIGTTIATTRSALDGTRAMAFDLGGFLGFGDFTGLRGLNVGSSFDAEVVETGPAGLRIAWAYALTVEAHGKTPHDVLGEPEVYQISETRSAGNYKAVRKIFYAPSIRGPVGFNYVDNTGVDERCILTAYRKPGEAAPRMTMAVVEASPPAPQPQPAPAPQPPAQSQAQAPQPAPQPAPAPAPAPKPTAKATATPSGAFPKGVRSMTIVTLTTNYNFDVSKRSEEPSKMIKVPIVGTSLIGDKVGEVYWDGATLTVVIDN